MSRLLCQGTSVGSGGIEASTEVCSFSYRFLCLIAYAFPINCSTLKSLCSPYVIIVYGKSGHSCNTRKFL